MSEGTRMMELARRLFPICRSITGNGVRETLTILKEKVPELTVHEVPSGTQVFDWTVPLEWNISEAYIENSQGERVIDFQNSNLHVLGYSVPVDKYVSLDELLSVVYTLPEQPDAIPYVTSYYKERYGFCMSENQKRQLREDTYHIVIRSELKQGSLTYGELKIKGETDEEIFFSTYVCHPSMANNELSGPVVCAELADYIKRMPRRRYSYRIIFIPETIGSITYLSRNLEEMQRHVIAGFNVSCVGDDRTYSYIASPYGDTLADRVAKNVLRFHYPDYDTYSYLERGSDERQYCAPGVALPLCAICRSKYEVYPEYHTSFDNMDLISAEGLQGAFDVFCKFVRALEANRKYRMNCFCEPQLGKRGLYPTISVKSGYHEVKRLRNFIAYADGRNDLLGISDIIGVPVDELIPIVEKLTEAGLLSAD